MCLCEAPKIIQAIIQWLGSQAVPTVAAAAVITLALWMALRFSYVLGLLICSVIKRAQERRAELPKPAVIPQALPLATRRPTRQPMTSQDPEVLAVRDWIRKGAKEYEPISK